MKQQKSSGSQPKPSYRPGVKLFMEFFDIGPGVALSAMLFTIAVIGFAIYYVIHSAPPSTIYFSAGPEGSIYQKNALKYADVLEKSGIKVKILTSEGSSENLKHLRDRAFKADVGFVQSGLSDKGYDGLISLGSISHQPIMVFYRGASRGLLSDFNGRRIAIGPKGSGSRKIALRLLEANNTKEGDGPTELLEWEGAAAAQALEDGKIDAAFLMSENLSTDVLHGLLRAKDVHLLSVKQASAYSRKYDYLSVLDLPEGAIDFATDIPDHDVTLLGTTVELIAKQNLHPAVVDLLVEAAMQTHGKPGLFQKRGEFPSMIEHEAHLSEDAVHFYQSGKTWLYRLLPFWFASLLSRVTFVFVPVLVILIPGLKSIPAFFRWRMQMKIRRRYRELLNVEERSQGVSDLRARAELQEEIDAIEESINKMKVRPAFADQFYGLRGHIDYVRGVLNKRVS